MIGVDTSKTTTYSRMQKYCELSDRLDTMTILHYQLCSLWNYFNSIFSLQITFWLTYSVIYIITQLFFDYLLLSFAVTLDFEKLLFLNITEIGISILHICLLANAFEIIVNEVSN